MVTIDGWLTRLLQKAKQKRKQGVFVYLTLLLSRNQAPELVNVDRRAVKLIQGLVEVTHANFAEITRVTVGRRENAECRRTWTKNVLYA